MSQETTTKKDSLNQLKEDIQRSSSNFSKLARTIAMAFCALTWVEFNDTTKRGLLTIVLSLIILYFIVELSQYLFSAFYARDNYKKLEEDKRKVAEVDTSMNRISKYTAWAVLIKFILLFAIAALLVYYFVNKWMLLKAA